MARLLREDIEANFSAEEQKDLLVVFSSHSLPLKALQQGDQYPLEIASTADMVMKQLGHKFPFRSFI